MQIVSNGDNLHEISNTVFSGKKKNITNVSVAELAQSVVMVNTYAYTWYTYCPTHLLTLKMPITTAADGVLIFISLFFYLFIYLFCIFQRK